LTHSRFLDVIFEHIDAFLGISNAANLFHLVDVNAGINLGFALKRRLIL